MESTNLKHNATGPVSVQVGVALSGMFAFSAGMLSLFRSKSLWQCLFWIVYKSYETWWAEDNVALAASNTPEWKAAAKSLPNPMRDPEGKLR